MLCQLNQIYQVLVSGCKLTNKQKGKNNMTVKELIKELETCKPDAVVSIVINEINLEVTELITPAPEIVELS